MTNLTPEQPKPSEFSHLPKNPETQSRINEMFTQSGVAKWMLQGLRDIKGTNQTLWDFDINDCNFGVYKMLGHDLKTKEASMVIEYPNPDPSYKEQLPRVETYFSTDPMFYISRGDKALTTEQQKVVEEALKLQEAEATPAS